MNAVPQMANVYNEEYCHYTENRPLEKL